ncbi:MAG: DUF1800 family protein [Parvularculaceae bacterium]|nr:DUF1800 family protein [Parvularculaceae bacterium]
MQGNTLGAAIAVNRFGMGARPGDLARIGADPRGWLKDQIGRRDAFALEDDTLPTRAEASESLRKFIKGVAATKPPQDMGAEAIPGFKSFTEALRAEIVARTRRALTTSDGFAERLVRFWSNHFTVAATKGGPIPFAGLYEREVIRAGMTGSFADLHLAVMRHPGMLIYLDQAVSVGPNSPAGKRLKRGLNENLAREALELHTVGPQGGYTQADVTEFARALTGWTIVSDRLRRFLPDAGLGDFVFAAQLHEPGPRTVMGKRYPEAGEEQAHAILADLARHPATANRIAVKLARHFIADTPPLSAVARLEKAFRDSDGDLPTLHQSLVDLPEAFEPEQRKFKTPDEFILSALRLAGLETVEPQGVFGAYVLLGQQPFSAPSPKGWADVADEWATPDAVMKRLQWSQEFARRLPLRTSPEQIAAAALGPFMSSRTSEAVRRAESGAQGLVLALMSPEFQRR